MLSEVNKFLSLYRAPSNESVSRAGLQYWPADSQRDRQVCISKDITDLAALFRAVDISTANILQI